MNKVIIKTILCREHEIHETLGDKETDLAKPGNRKWLMSHIIWAAKFGYQVTVTPA